MFRFPLNDDYELRLLEMRHAKAVFAAIDRNREHLTPWMPWVEKTKDVKDTRQYIRSEMKKYAAGESMAAAIWRGDLVVGAIGFHRFDFTNRRTSLGYWLDKDHQGKGVITLAVRAFLEFALRDLNMNRIEICAAVENVRSRAVCERLGLAKEGVRRQAEKVGDRLLDHAVYVAIAGEWPK